jgi:hypothetical protein
MLSHGSVPFPLFLVPSVSLERSRQYGDIWAASADPIAAFKLVGFCKGWVGTSRVEPVCQEEITHEPDVRMNREKAAS